MNSDVVFWQDKITNPEETTEAVCVFDKDKSKLVFRFRVFGKNTYNVTVIEWDPGACKSTEFLLDLVTGKKDISIFKEYGVFSRT